VVHVWLPLFTWTLRQVWKRIAMTAVRWHGAYDRGLPRLSCCFCIFMPKPALVLSGRFNLPLLREYVAVEREVDSRFRQDVSLAEVLEAVERGDEPGEIRSWEM
jgi:3'-phosphoadenosine 5'-phosphosulfate sulfotransferase (PAPS reductase)/FAD synthetase